MTTGIPGSLPRGTTPPSRLRGAGRRQGNPPTAHHRASEVESDLECQQGENNTIRQENQLNPCCQQILTGCPRDEDHAPTFFSWKCAKQQINNPRISRNTRASINLQAINLNGLKTTSLAQDSHKWHKVHRLMGEQKIGILQPFRGPCNRFRKSRFFSHKTKV
jgi:hypothetical protein